ncbi:GNAT family N-acetyltransferase [Haladaptatus sp. CMSO5]|uniref:GNAT family N-acetyltransferase n=1 Tax=Haladaptatus sp. CMSO5 TaxID=3120514 RepID=UPI002FCE304E
MSSPVTIRAAEPEDVAAIQRVARASYEAAYLEIIGQEELEAAMDAWYNREKVRDAIVNPETIYVVAEADEVVGYASGGDASEVATGELYSIYVHPDWWGKGVGTQLLSTIEAALRERGLSKLRLEVFAENDVGRAFYEARGFERVGEQETDLFTGQVVGIVVYAMALD